jgi:hypothetical protein
MRARVGVGVGVGVDVSVRVRVRVRVRVDVCKAFERNREEYCPRTSNDADEFS